MALPPNKAPGRCLSNNGLSSVYSADNDEHNQPLINLLNFSASLQKGEVIPHLKDRDHKVPN